MAVPAALRMCVAEIKFNGDIAHSGALHHERMVVLLDYATIQLRREGFGRPPRTKACKLNLDPDPARDALGGLDERWQFKSARGRACCLGLIKSWDSGSITTALDNSTHTGSISTRLHTAREPVLAFIERRAGECARFHPAHHLNRALLNGRRGVSPMRCVGLRKLFALP